jgi:hypothetical protein
VKGLRVIFGGKLNNLLLADRITAKALFSAHFDVFIKNLEHAIAPS